MSRPTKIILVDGDIVLHVAATSAEKAVDWGDGILSSYADITRAEQLVDIAVADILERTGGTEVRFALSDPDHRWRPLILPEYKSGRKKAKPLVYRNLVTYAKKVYDAQVIPWLEGDDLLGLWATEGGERGAVVWSEDKDLMTVPCFLYRGRGADPTLITEDEADINHLTQALTGDPTDGYPGCPKVGPVGARGVLAAAGEPRERWGAVVRCYAKARLTEGDALAQARVARILRDGEHGPPGREGADDIEYVTGVQVWDPRSAR